MKRIMAWILSLALVMLLAACGSPSASSETQPTETEAAALVEVAITMDNWQDYFELREAQQVQIDDRGDIMLREFGYGVFLKEEYRERVPQGGANGVSFEMKVRSVRRQVMGDLLTDNYILKDEVLNDEGDVILTRSVEDWRGSSQMEAGSDFEDAVAAFFTVNGEFAG